MSKDTRDSSQDTNYEVLSTEVKGFRGRAWLIRARGKHFVISAISNEFATETMAFAADESGDVTSWTDLATVRGQDHEACIATLLRNLGGAQ